MKLFIPPLRTKLRLTEAWLFPIHMDYRNSNFRRAMLGDLVITTPPPVLPEIIRLEPGTILAVDRIYIRKGQDGFDSVTFRVVDSPNKALLSKSRGGTMQNGQARFWVKLLDANNINCEIVE